MSDPLVSGIFDMASAVIMISSFRQSEKGNRERVLFLGVSQGHERLRS